MKTIFHTITLRHTMILTKVRPRATNGRGSSPRTHLLESEARHPGLCVEDLEDDGGLALHHVQLAAQGSQLGVQVPEGFRQVLHAVIAHRLCSGETGGGGGSC